MQAAQQRAALGTARAAWGSVSPLSCFQDIVPINSSSAAFPSDPLSCSPRFFPALERFDYGYQCLNYRQAVNEPPLLSASPPACTRPVVFAFVDSSCPVPPLTAPLATLFIVSRRSAMDFLPLAMDL